MELSDETLAVFEQIATLLESGGVGGVGSKPTIDLVFWINTGSSLQKFQAPFDLAIVSMRSKSPTRAIVSTNGRTAFDSNNVSGSGGGLIGCVGLNQPWDGNFGPIVSGSDIWISCPIGNEVEFTVVHL